MYTPSNFTFTFSVFGSLCLVVFAWVYYLFRVANSRSPPFPPGPPRYPLIGNLLDIPPHNQEKAFSELAQNYGDVIYLRVLGTEIIVLDSLQAARDLLQKKSLKYSDRPRFVLLGELMGWDPVVTQLPYGERFRKHRRFVQDYLAKDVVRSHRDQQEYEASAFVQSLITTPKDFRLHIRKFSAASILQIAYGHHVKSLADPYVQLAERAMGRTVEAATPGSMIVDFLPALKHLPTWMPGAGFKREALSIRKDVEKFLNVPFQMVKDNMASGSVTPSLTSSLLSEFEKSSKFTSEDEDDIKGAAGVLYAAATDTTVAVIATFIYAMVLHPEVYRRAQEEMDRVVGHAQLPDSDDRASLPYLECIIKECYRWNSPVPLGVPHRTMEDDLYRGYHIPKGAIVIANIWAMTQDEKMFSRPESFLPERFLDPNVLDPREIVFGFGRRECPGKLFADTNIWLAAASIVATLHLSKKDKDLMTPTDAFTHGAVRHPKTFDCVIQPRSDKARELVLQTCTNREV